MQNIQIYIIKRAQLRTLLHGLWVPLCRHQAQSWVQKVSWCSCFPLMLKLTSQPTFLANFINSQTLWYCLLLLCRKLSTLSIPRRQYLRSGIEIQGVPTNEISTNMVSTYPNFMSLSWQTSLIHKLFGIACCCSVVSCRRFLYQEENS